ncbi:MAG TPA: hypothetical protein VHO69_04400 [Phototrophicaceae bacterium]|nr:hypothetical protein [Phototrophicaceae bacterium]
MEIFGIGGAELVAILIIALIVAGPKRMIQWAYIIGKYTAKARALWAESMTYVQQELKEAGMDVELPKEPPTRASLNKQINKALAPVTNPIQTALNETNAQLNEVKQQMTVSESNGRGLNLPKATPPPGDSQPNLGTWSGGETLDE